MLDVFVGDLADLVAGVAIGNGQVRARRNPNNPTPVFVGLICAINRVAVEAKVDILVTVVIPRLSESNVGREVVVTRCGGQAVSAVPGRPRQIPIVALFRAICLAADTVGVDVVRRGKSCRSHKLRHHTQGEQDAQEPFLHFIPRQQPGHSQEVEELAVFNLV